MTLAADEAGEHGLKLHFKTGNGASLTVDRGEAGEAVNPEYGTARSISLPDNEDLSLRIYLDHSLFEIFVGGGREVITGRYFAPKGQIFAKMSKGVSYKGKSWKLKNM